MNKIYESFGFLFAKASNQLQEKILPFLSEYDLSYKQMGMLLIIYENDGITQKKAGDIQQTDRTTVTQIIDYLEKCGYVLRIKNKNDRRSYGLSLTSTGNDLVKEIFIEIDKIQKEYFSKLSIEEVKLLRKIMITLTKGVITNE
ncbi:MarR family transcriptional regulator [Clostridium sp.]|uniref:MarR family winged helix-turn-helix transcriptional regulator n=1 Tax=Clostridium sp. TaxID=1506 RepID=UPI001D4CDF46|nr:MarR family transcriptional regulator [Clostridium sp.]MBS5306488.1 MarR family transcriptional regulator [Clostridium sp.]